MYGENTFIRTYRGSYRILCFDGTNGAWELPLTFEDMKIIREELKTMDIKTLIDKMKSDFNGNVVEHECGGSEYNRLLSESRDKNSGWAKLEDFLRGDK